MKFMRPSLSFPPLKIIFSLLLITGSSMIIFHQGWALKNIIAEKSSLQEALRNLARESAQRLAFLEEISHEQSTFEEMKHRRFLDPAERLKMEEAIAKISRLYRIEYLTFELEAEKVLSSPEGGGFCLTSAPLKIRFEALWDEDALNFIKGVMEDFPGFLWPEEIKLNRPEGGRAFLRGGPYEASQSSWPNKVVGEFQGHWMVFKKGAN